MDKLKLIAETINQLCFDKFGLKTEYSFEKKFDWLHTNPLQSNYNTHWKTICNVYSLLTDKKLDLNIQTSCTNYNSKSNQQEVDIWFGNPFNFIVEFDEKQHFNQFRLLTLSFYSNLKYSFLMDDYKSLCQKCINPSKSGFTKIKENILFPHFYLNEEKQDNRIRQRAFRDFIKDITTNELQLNPIIRIPFTITNKKIKDFTENDLQQVKRYIIENNFLDKLKL